MTIFELSKKKKREQWLKKETLCNYLKHVHFIYIIKVSKCIWERNAQGYNIQILINKKRLWGGICVCVCVDAEEENEWIMNNIQWMRGKCNSKHRHISSINIERRVSWAYKLFIMCWHEWKLKGVYMVD